MKERSRIVGLIYYASSQAAPATAWRPPMDIYRTKNGWLLKFELAGVELEDIHVYAHERTLTVSGVRRDTVLEPGASYYSMEIPYNRFERAVELPCDLEAAHLEAECRNGILLIRVITE